LSSRLSRTVKIEIYKPTILSSVLYGCETWSVTLREEHTLKVFGEQGADENIWKQKIPRLMRWLRYAACMGIVGRCEGKRPLGRTGCTWEDNIKMNLEGNRVVIMWLGFICFKIGSNVRAVIKPQVPQKYGNLLIN
jgi:hypothetical protein